MKTKNFTICGELVSVIAHLHSEMGTPVFDLNIGNGFNEMAKEDMTLEEIKDLCTTVRNELEEILDEWTNTARRLSEFNAAWSKDKEEGA